MSRSDDHHLNGADVKGTNGGASAASYRSNRMRPSASCRFRLMAVLVAGMVLTGALGDAFGASGASASRWAVVFARKCFVEDRVYGWQVMWQPGTHTSQQRVVYETAPTRGLVRIPSRLGYLPSPDGRWLLVWETTYPPETPDVLTTTWTAVTLPTGEHVAIAAMQGLAGAFPHWLDDHQVVLEKAGESAVFDVALRRLTGKLPERQEPTQTAERDVDDDNVSAAWRQQFLKRYFQPQLECARGAAATPQLDLRRFLQPREFPDADTVEAFLLRPMGLVQVVGYMERKESWPSLAVAPNCGMIARAAVLPVGLAMIDYDSGEHTMGTVVRPELAVYDFRSGKQLWRERSRLWSGPQASDVGVELPGDAWEPSYRDIRWSGDGRYLSFTRHNNIDEHGRLTDSTAVVDSTTWTRELRLWDVTNAFVVPNAEQMPTGETTRTNADR